MPFDALCRPMPWLGFLWGPFGELRFLGVTCAWLPFGEVVLGLLVDPQVWV